jgi:hypothetical protein
MTGPSYPRPPIPGGVGQFQIGVSPIGMYTFDPWATIISQYANSPIIDSLITSFNAAMNIDPLLDNWYDMIWNVLSAQGYGLDVWGRIVGVTRALQIPNSTVTYLGFEESGNDWVGFDGTGIFYSGSSALTTSFNLDDGDFRTLILAKAAGNISSGAIPAVNAILLALFPGQGVCYVQDNRNMTVTYVFNFKLTAIQAAILGQANVLPTAAGVGVTIQHI